MGTKVISIMDDAYELLRKNKKPNESFSEVIRRVVPKKRNIMEFAGAWADMTDAEADRMMRNIAEVNEKLTKEIIRKTSRP
ncbi:MAG: antitoxin VapB family protein [Nanoarchaeota archaeon]